MAREQGGEQASYDLLGSVPLLHQRGGSESLTTVLVAFAANVLIAVAKTVAAAVTGSASLVAEAAHSWADTGNEILLLIANRRSRRPPDRAHPLGHGREAYVWSLFAALGLFVAGGAVSVTYGIQELIHPEPAIRFAVGYVVLAVSFVLEGISFRQSVRQAKHEAKSIDRDLFEHVLATSDPTLRAVFAEDSTALVGGGLLDRRHAVGDRSGRFLPSLVCLGAGMHGDLRGERNERGETSGMVRLAASGEDAGATSCLPAAVPAELPACRRPGL